MVQPEKKRKGKGKGKANPPTQISDTIPFGNFRALQVQHAHEQRQAKSTRRAFEGALTDLQRIEQSPDDDSDSDSSSDDSSSDEADRTSFEYEGTGARASNLEDVSEKEVDRLRRENEEISAQLAQMRALGERNAQLAFGATPGASGSGSHFPPHPVAAPAVPVARGQPAFNPRPVCPLPRIPPPPTADPHQFVEIPRKKTRYKIRRIRRKAGLQHNGHRWKEISDIIRNLIARVGLDYTNTWANQDRRQLGHLYDMIHEKVPELAHFENGWATVILVQRRFNNQVYHMRKRLAQSATTPVDDSSDDSAPSSRKPQKPRQPPRSDLNKSNPLNPHPEPTRQEPTDQALADQEPPHPEPSRRPNEQTNQALADQESARQESTHQKPSRTLLTYFNASATSAPQRTRPLLQGGVRPPESWGSAGTQLISGQGSHESASQPNAVSLRQSSANSLEPPRPTGSLSLPDPARPQALDEQSSTPSNTHPSSSSRPSRTRKDWKKWAADNHVDDGTSRYALRSTAAAAHAMAQTEAAIGDTTTSGVNKKRKAEQLPSEGTKGPKKRKGKAKKGAKPLQPPFEPGDTDSGGRPSTEEDG